MYGGDLFGDLPSAKNEKTNPKQESQSQSSKNNGTGLIKNSDNNSAFANSSNTISSGKKSISLVSTLGNAGTSMAFVPAALLTRKQKRPLPASTVNATTKISQSSVTSTSETSKKESVNPLKKVKLSREEENDDGEGTKTSFEVNNGLNDKTNDDKVDAENKENAPDNKKEKGKQRLNATDEKEYIYNEIESEKLQNLHQSITPTTAYDPLVPNDYLSYKQQQQNERVRIEMERKAKETLEAQSRLRERIEEERRAVEATGDVEKIIESRVGTNAVEGSVGTVGSGEGRGRGRGRGRGLSNLPAWLVKKQAEQQKEKIDGTTPDSNTHGSSTSVDGQFEDGNINHGDCNGSTSQSNVHVVEGCTVLLSNMVGPGEVDDELAEEVKEECELKCGKVMIVFVKDANFNEPTSSEVRVFVTFERKEFAQKAANVFHGRMFGNRQISARLV